MKIRTYLVKHLLVFLLLVAMLACDDKEDYTLPADLRMQFELDDQAVLNGALSVEYLSINIASIDIEGYREVGEDIFFTRNFSEGKKFILNYASVPDNETLSFDVPQGIYNPFFFSLNFIADEDQEDFIEDIEEWYQNIEEDEMSLEELQEELGDIIEDYLEDVESNFMLKGQYVRNQEQYNFIFVINDLNVFKIRAKNKNGDPEIALKKDIINKGRMVFNPSYWFSAISPAMIDDAHIGTIDGEKYIFLHKHINSQIYTTVFNRIEESVNLIINE
ncbi:MAG: hypothetical protein ACOCWC_05305 [Bacteroidota bacterium]